LQINGGNNKRSNLKCNFREKKFYTINDIEHYRMALAQKYTSQVGSKFSEKATVSYSDDNTHLGSMAKDSRCQGKLQKKKTKTSKSSNYHETYM